jgi:hypothetical protein
LRTTLFPVAILPVSPITYFPGQALKENQLLMIKLTREDTTINRFVSKFHAMISFT